MNSKLPEYTSSSEVLPNYTSSINFYGLALLKTEFLTPYQYNNGHRSWKPVLLHMNSTQLNMYNLNADKKLQDLLINLYFELNNLNQLTIDLNTEYKKNNGMDFNSNQVDLNDIFSGDAYGGLEGNKSMFSESKFGKLKNKLKTQKNHKILATISNYYNILKDNQLLFEPSSADIKGTTFEKFKGSLLHSYSLAHLQVGEAPSLNQLISAMYKEDHTSSTSNTSSLVKYKNSLRLRIEYKQVLLQFWSFHGMISWFRNLSIGKDLSLPLELRTVTKLKSIPSRYSSRNNALLAATAAAASYGRGRHHSVESSNDDRAMIRASQLTHKELDSDVVSTDGEDESIFDNVQHARRESATSSISSSDDMDYVTINDYKFVSKENAYTTVEKQYISNCVPDLNSFDKWNGKLITVSNAEFFVRDERNYKNKDDVFISYNALGDLVQSYDRKSSNAHQQNKLSSTRTFLIHQSGLVGVAQEC
ncbi:hypothetical protein CANMA_002544 [Candida margitis]|uniref:uncharacterized protein n=1 Tax=Candida margitis TaxID=1775924 RepID=UPI002225FB84|nr:uncharacterized protein CANMA_002544 [Candida margitis]KAI5968328.1 hypothetical protein CANMA_002544 [Candida margitis]